MSIQTEKTKQNPFDDRLESVLKNYSNETAGTYAKKEGKVYKIVTLIIRLNF